MNNNVLFLLGKLPTPIIIMALSAMIWKNPPKQNENIGYRTTRSQKSEEAWKYAQTEWGKISTIIFAVFTALTIILEVIAIKVNFDESTGFIVFIAHTVFLVILLFIPVIIVENKLKKRFDEDGNLRENGNID